MNALRSISGVGYGKTSMGIYETTLGFGVSERGEFFGDKCGFEGHEWLKSLAARHAVSAVPDETGRLPDELIEMGKRVLWEMIGDHKLDKME